MNKAVSFELALKLKEKGFNEEGLIFWWDNILYHYHTLPISKKKGIYTWLKQGILLHAPTIADVVMWLYEKHGIWIYPRPILNPLDKVVWRVVIMNINKKMDSNIWEKWDGIIDDIFTTSPTESYEAAIEYCLNNLI